MAFTFGLEFEVVTSASQTTIVYELQRNGFSASAGHYSTRNVGTGTWLVKPDCSISRGWEIVSPPLTLQQVQSAMPALQRVLDSIGATADRSCGLHVHIGGFGSLEFAAVRNVVRRYANFEDTIDLLCAPHRRGSEAAYANSIIANWTYQHGSRARALEVMWEKVQAASTREDLINLFPERSSKLNLQALHRHGTIEVRQKEGTTNCTDVAHWVSFLDQFTRVAMEQTRLWKRPNATPETTAERVKKMTRKMDRATCEWVKAKVRSA